jgi:hypothetical protein
MSSFRGKFDFGADPNMVRRNNIRLFFHKWLEKLNDGTAMVGFGPIKIDLRVEFERRIAQLDDDTLAEMVEDAHNL